MTVQFNFLKIKEGSIIILSNGIIIKILRLNNSVVKIRLIYYPDNLTNPDLLTIKRLYGNLEYNLIGGMVYVFKRDFTLHKDLFITLYKFKTDYTVLSEIKYIKQIQSLFTKYISPFSKVIIDYYTEGIRYECN